MARASLAETVIGFSIRTWMPLSIAAIAWAPCRLCGEATTSASIGASFSIAAKSSGTIRDVEARLHLGEFRLAEPANRDEIHVGARFQDRQVVGDRPPARAHNANA